MPSLTIDTTGGEISHYFSAENNKIINPGNLSDSTGRAFPYLTRQKNQPY